MEKAIQQKGNEPSQVILAMRYANRQWDDQEEDEVETERNKKRDRDRRRQVRQEKQIWIETPKDSEKNY